MIFPRGKGGVTEVCYDFRLNLSNIIWFFSISVISDSMAFFDSFCTSVIFPDRMSMTLSSV